MKDFLKYDHLQIGDIVVCHYADHYRTYLVFGRSPNEGSRESAAFAKWESWHLYSLNDGRTYTLTGRPRDRIRLLTGSGGTTAGIYRNGEKIPGRL